MNGINVTITDMMNCRDRRVSIQNELISKYDKPVLSFCMNIPGPVKTNELIRKAFDSGKAELLKALSAHNITILHTEEFHEPSGDELIMALDAPAEDIKTLATDVFYNEEEKKLMKDVTVELQDSKSLGSHGLLISIPNHNCEIRWGDGIGDYVITEDDTTSIVNDIDVLVSTMKLTIERYKTEYYNHL